MVTDRRTTDGRTTDAGVTGILIAHLGAFGSGELINFSYPLLSGGLPKITCLSFITEITVAGQAGVMKTKSSAKPKFCTKTFNMILLRK